MLKADRDISKKRAAEAANEIKNGHRLPEVRVQSISNNRKVTLEFTNEMVITSDLELILKKIEKPSTDAVDENKPRFLNKYNKRTKSTEPKQKLVREDLIDVILFDPEEDKISDNLAAWSISSVDSRSIVIDLEITSPLIVSQGDNPDQLLI